jgi:acetate kinase
MPLRAKQKKVFCFFSSEKKILSFLGTPVPDAILTLNAGSSSLKLALFEIGPDNALTRQLRGGVSGIGETPRLVIRDAGKQVMLDHTFNHGAATEHEAFLTEILDFVESHLGGDTLTGIGHRVVHGGATHAGPALVTPELVDELEKFCPLAPLHQPHNLAPIRTLEKLRPDLKQVACFDTAFHHGLPRLVTRFALPIAYEQEGVRRYGFHGLSYAFIAGRLRQLAPDLAKGKIVALHLGAGASMCAIQDGHSVDTTMGFTALDGLIMGTRCGAIDAGVLLYMLQQQHLTPERIQNILYKESGLLGLSGISGDMQHLHASTDPRAHEAIDLFCYRIICDCGALAASLGGLDGLVFTAGIGENDPAIRAQVCAGLAWMGIELDEAANQKGGGRISAPSSRIEVWAIPTDEERMIATETLGLVG